VTPSAKREILAVLVQDHGLPVRRACQAVRLSRAAYYRPPRSRLLRDTDVVTALNDVVARHTRWGFWKCFYRLRRAGHGWNHKRVHRVYCALRLNLPRRTKRRVPARVRQPLVAPARLNESSRTRMTRALGIDVPISIARHRCLPPIRRIGLTPRAAGIHDAVHRRETPSPPSPGSATAHCEARVRL